MSSFFEYFFEEVDGVQEETPVLCPYPHYTENGLIYSESNPSAGVNIDKGVFNCLRCGKSNSEVGFIRDQIGCSYEQAVKIQQAFESNSNPIEEWRTTFPKDPVIEMTANNLGISNKVLDELDVRSPDMQSITFPVSIYGNILDTRAYNPGGRPKVKSRQGAMSGLILPFDLWRESPIDKWTLLCAGEKDMAVARSHGFNAITVTGGENTVPIMLNEFKDRKIAILYDNDDVGRSGGAKVAAVIKDYAAEVRLVTGFHEVCSEKGEDLTDFFMKYGKTKNDLIKYISQTPEFTEQEAQAELEKLYPTVTLFQAAQPNLIGKVVRSNIQIVASYESTFTIPSTIQAKKFVQPEDKCTMSYNETRVWDLSENTAKDILHMMDNNFKEKDIAANIKGLLRIPQKEKGVKIYKPSKETVFKCGVTDLFESTTKDTTSMEYTAYSIGNKLESGKKYKATYMVVPHPYQGQQLTMIILDVDEAADTVSSFKITEEVKKNLDVIKDIDLPVREKVKHISDKVKGIIGFDAPDTLIQTIDLAYHTVLEFNFGKRFTGVRGYLDTLVVSESRVGKSSTAEALQEAYGLGTFASLAGSSATKAGLIGGSNKVQGTHQTRAGLIPQNHRGLIIFEELAKCDVGIIREMTDIRSSNEVRIVRVNGALYLPALVRMITLTNVKSSGHMTRPITSYPNGIEIIAELVGTAEDIARYDLMLVLASPGARNMDYNWVPETPFDDEVYKTRIRWVWSREAEQVKIDDDVLEYIIEQCNTLNDKYDSHIKIFGTEAWKKVTRLAIAVSGYIVSTDETYENIVVTKEAVDFAVEFYTKIYDNPTFKLKEYVDNERAYSEIDADGVERLQDIYTGQAALLNQLEMTSTNSRNELMAATGLSTEEFNKVMNSLIKGMFVRYIGQNIMATERFRKGMAMINRNIEHPRHGEVSV